MANRNEYQRVLMEQRRRAERLVELPAIVDVKRRKACVKSLGKFAKTYYGEMFNKPWSQAHKICIANMEYTIKNGGQFCFALPRGEGKTTLSKVAGIWAMLAGHRRYPILIGATEPKAEKLLKDVKAMLRFSDTLAEDFPEVCWPIRALENNAIRCKAQEAQVSAELADQLRALYNPKTKITGEPTKTEMTWTAKVVVLPTVEGCPTSGCVIEIGGLTGDIRGRCVVNSSGEVLRPDLAIPDDPQTHDSAKSPTQCADREEIINADVMGLAGPGEKITVFMPCTVIKHDDLASRLLDPERNPDWQGERHAMITSWPEDMDKWEEYNRVRIDGLRAKDGGKAANKFYRKYKKELEKGASVSWEARKDTKDCSALQHAMDLFFRLGEKAFLSEYQNEPPMENMSIYELQPEMVKGRAVGMEYRHIPIHAQFLTGMIDVNRYGLHYTVMGVTNDFACSICDYGKWPPSYKEVIWSEEKHGGKTEAQAIYEAVYNFCTEIAGRHYMRGNDRKLLDLLTVDCGYLMDMVFRATEAVNQVLPVQVVASRGRSTKFYRENKAIGRLGDHCYRDVWQQKGRVLVHNADYWRSRCQQGWLLSPGAPGSISLFGNSSQHDNFADQICSEVLREHVKTDKAEFYDWQKKPGLMNDLLDSTVGAMAAASIVGASFDNPKGNYIPGAEKESRPQQTVRQATYSSI